MMGIAFFALLQVLAFHWQSCVSLAAASVAEKSPEFFEEPTRHHGHHKRHHKADKHADDEEEDEAVSERARDSEATLTPGGAIHRGHSMMRRESERFGAEEHGESHHGKHHHTKALFTAMDLNGDGKITQGEINHVHELFAESPEDVQERGRHVANMVVKDIDTDDDGAIDFDEFVASLRQDVHSPSKHAHKGHRHSTGVSHHKHHKQQGKQYYSAVEETEAEPYYSTVEEHRPSRMPRGEGFSQAALNERSGTVNTPELKVSCGGHRAPSCAECPTYSPLGDTMQSRGSEYCHHDCRWCSSGGNAGVCINNKTGVCIDEGANIANDHAQPMPATVKQPDLFDPNMTDKDHNIANEAAEAAIKEENLEAAERQKQEEEEAEGKKFSWSKFWLIVVITFSVILGICAIISVVALVVFCCMGVNENAPKELTEEGDGEDEGEEATEEAGADEAES